MLVVTLILALALAVLAAIFALQNPTPTEIAFFEWNATGGLALFLIIAYGAGILTGVLLMLPGSVKTRAQLMMSRRKLDSIAKTADKAAEQKPAKEPAS